MRSNFKYTGNKVPLGSGDPVVVSLSTYAVVRDPDYISASIPDPSLFKLRASFKRVAKGIIATVVPGSLIFPIDSSCTRRVVREVLDSLSWWTFKH